VAAGTMSTDITLKGTSILGLTAFILLKLSGVLI